MQRFLGFLFLVLLSLASATRANTGPGAPATSGRRVLVIWNNNEGFDDQIVTANSGLIKLLTSTGAFAGLGFNFTVESLMLNSATFNAGNTYANGVSAAAGASLPLTAANYCLVFDMRFHPINYTGGARPGDFHGDSISAADVTAYASYVQSGGGLFVMGDNYWSDALARADGFISRMENMYQLFNGIAATGIGGSSQPFKIGPDPDTFKASGLNPYNIETDYNVLGAGTFGTHFDGYFDNAANSLGSGKKWIVQNSDINKVLGIAWGGADVKAGYTGSMVYFGDSSAMNDWASGSNSGLSVFMKNAIDFLYNDTCCTAPTTLCAAGPQVDDPGDNPVIECFADNVGHGYIFPAGTGSYVSGSDYNGVGGFLRNNVNLFSDNTLFERDITAGDLALYSGMCFAFRHGNAATLSIQIWDQSFANQITTAPASIPAGAGWTHVCLTFNSFAATATQVRFRIMYSAGTGAVNYDLDAVSLIHACGSHPEVVDPACCTLASPTSTDTPSRTPTFTATRTNSPSSTPTLTRTSTVTPSPSPTATPTFSETVTRTSTVTPSPTPTASSTFSQTATRTSTVTASPTPTETATPSMSPTRTVSPSATDTITLGPTPTFTSTSTVTPSATPTPTSTATPTPSPSRTATMTATTTPSPSPTATVSPTRTGTPTSTGTISPGPSPTDTPTVTPTPTFSETPSVTDTSSVTSTPTDTPSVTETGVFSATNTPTITETFTVTATPSATVTPSASGTVSPTRTSTATPSGTPTYTATPSLTPSATPSPTFTETPSSSETPTASPSYSASPSITVSPTWTLTHVPVPVHLTVSLYNAAGERVRQLFDGGANLIPTDINFLGGSLVVSGVQGINLGLGTQLSNGQNSLAWSGENDSGQPVAGGTYYFKVETQDQFGHTTSIIKGVQVIAGPEHDRLAIFNSAGEKVWEQAVGAGVSQAASLELSTDAYGVAYDAATGKALDPLVFTLKDNAGGVATVSWDGRSLTGQPVASGSYTVQLITGIPGSASVIQTKSIVVINSGVGLPSTEAYLVPNPARAGDTLRLVYPLAPGAMGACRLFNLAGELVATAEDPQRTGSLNFGKSNLASGVYLAEFEQRMASRPMQRRLLKLAVVK